MGINRISYEGLEIAVSNSKLQEALAKLDRDGNSAITIDDFRVTSAAAGPETADTAMRKAVASAFEQAGMFKYPTQRAGLEKLFELYPRLAGFEKAVGELMKNHIDNGSTSWRGVREMEFPRAFWLSSVVPQVSGSGALAPAQVTALTVDVMDMIHQISGSTLPQTMRESTPATEDLFEMTYNRCAVPAELAAPLEQFTNAYLASADRFLSYTEVECEGAGCKWFGDEIQLSAARRMMKITQADNTSSAYLKFPENCCFTGTTFVKTGEDKVITLEDVARRQITPWESKMPSMQTYDECTGNTVVRDEVGLTSSKQVKVGDLLMLGLRDQSGRLLNRLQIAPSHPLLAMRNGAERWVPAGELKDGDVLKGTGGASFTVSASDTAAYKGTFTYYNVATHGNDARPTYLVSPDGNNWLITHQKN